MKKIDLMIVGAPKSGTTSLKNYLGLHPNIITHSQIEFGFFLANNEIRMSYVDIYKKYFKRNEKKNIKVLVAKNAGMMHYPHSIESLYKHNHECQIVLILREPVKRTISAFNHEIRLGALAPQDFNSFIKKLLTRCETEEDLLFKRILIERTKYDWQLENILKVFPQKQVIVLFNEEMKKQPHEVLSKITERFGLPSLNSSVFNEGHNVSYAIRSKKIARFNHWLLRDNNPLKKMAKMVIPSQFQYMFSKKIHQLNSKPSKISNSIDLETKEMLKDYYNDSVINLERILDKKISCWDY